MGKMLLILKAIIQPPQNYLLFKGDPLCFTFQSIGGYLQLSNVTIKFDGINKLRYAFSMVKADQLLEPDWNEHNVRHIGIHGKRSEQM